MSSLDWGLLCTGALIVYIGWRLVRINHGGDE